jgi:hypothetical protein
MKKFIKDQKVRIKTYKELVDEFPEYVREHGRVTCGNENFVPGMRVYSNREHLITEIECVDNFFYEYGYVFTPEMCEVVD